ncbi:ferrochelatase [Thermonema lapsum]|uniref:Ferrochelatase n=1 Tax=Thermonema lapsum TaxID=28195 RepID=A0A846MTC5_9BACT|nr:ferrochelatase [Thermonema lapsum]NIK74705.1 ferrochelatase [Thermonema lapsum]
MKKAVLLVNLGTPDAPHTPEVRRYLKEFLLDGRVIDIPALSRWLLVNLIIAPFRAPRSAKAYRKLWTAEGSPLKVYGERLKTLLQDALGEDYEVYLAMRYQNPSMRSILAQIQQKAYEQIILLPLFPQYASATSGSVIQKFYDETRHWQAFPSISIVSYFYNHPAFVQALASRARPYIEADRYDYFVFSYHGVPVRQIQKADLHGCCLQTEDKKVAGCCSRLHEQNQYCYRAQCFATTRLLAEALQLPAERCITAFQSRLGKAEWIQPYTEDVIRQLAEQGAKKVLAFSPAFIADCLETTIEVGEEYKELFEALGGEKWVLVESLNDHASWVEALRQIVTEATLNISRQTVPTQATTVTNQTTA